MDRKRLSELQRECYYHYAIPPLTDDKAWGNFTRTSEIFSPLRNTSGVKDCLQQLPPLDQIQKSISV